MIGAILGDLIGSVYEFYDFKQYDFPLISEDSVITDDSYMTMGVAKAIFDCNGDYSDLSKKSANAMREIGRAFPKAGYGWKFYDWVMYSKDGEEQGYGSWGNGAGMRISPVGFVAKTEQEVKELSRKVTEITHNHPEGLKGAEAIAMCIFLAKGGKSKEEIRAYYGLPKGAWELAKSVCPENYFKYIEKLELEYGVPGDENTVLEWDDDVLEE